MLINSGTLIVPMCQPSYTILTALFPVTLTSKSVYNNAASKGTLPSLVHADQKKPPPTPFEKSHPHYAALEIGVMPSLGKKCV
jgi:hypothetical protein